MSMEGAAEAYRDIGEPVGQVNVDIDPLSDQYWNPIAIAAGDLVKMTLAEEEGAWAARQEERMRAAGSRATWDGRRDLRGRHSEAVDFSFRGRYVGPCRVLDRQLVVEYGDIDELRTEAA